MAEAATLHDAFIEELHDTYDAEKQLTKACPGSTARCFRRLIVRSSA
jgi:ferritin-like metal-binding protein YciE